MLHTIEFVGEGLIRRGTETVRAVLAAARDSALDHILPLTILLTYTISNLAYTKYFHLEQYSRFSLYGKTGFHLFVLSLVCFFIGYCARIQLKQRPDRLIPHAVRSLRTHVFTWHRLFNVVFAITCFYLLLAVFSNYKRLIPLVMPFYLDEFFAELDRTIHFGVEPWRILQPVLGYPLVTFFINFLYNIWIFLLIMVFYWQAFVGRDKELRLQYITAFLLCWVLIGTVAATLLSSAGPCYYGRFVDGPNPYQALIDYLHRANEYYPIWALDMQSTLLDNFENRRTVLASGITAMPSMHVSIAWLMVLLGWRVNRTTGILFSIYCAFIVVGSVHLGWHYAVDGYASIILTTIIWKVSGVLSNMALRRDGQGGPFRLFILPYHRSDAALLAWEGGVFICWVSLCVESEGVLVKLMYFKPLRVGSPMCGETLDRGQSVIHKLWIAIIMLILMKICFRAL